MSDRVPASGQIFLVFLPHRKWILQVCNYPQVFAVNCVGEIPTKWCRVCRSTDLHPQPLTGECPQEDHEEGRKAGLGHTGKVPRI